MLLRRFWRWQTTQDCEMPSLLDTLQVLFIGSDEQQWPSLQPERVIYSVIRLLYWDPLHLRLLQKKNVFGYFRGIISQFEQVQHKLPNMTTFRVHLCGFQITRGKKQYTIFQRTNYLGLNWFGHVIQGVSKYMKPINIMIYYRDKCNGGHLEHIQKKCILLARH